MKTLSAFTETAIDNPYVDVIRLLEITIGSTTLYFCDRVFGDDHLCTFNGQLYEPMVLAWDTIKVGRIDPVTYETEPGSAGFTIDNSKPVGGAASFTALFIDNDPQYCSITISEIHAGASAAADKENLFVGHIEDITEMTIDRTTVMCSGFELSIINKFAHTIVDDTTYPGADPDDIGRMVPVLYGPSKRIPCLSVDAGGKTTIAQDMTDTSPGNSGTLDVSDASALPSSGAFIIQIDAEQVSIASRSGNTLTLASSGARGYDSTTAVAHDLGAPMAEIQAAYIYLVADHPVKSIDAVYVDDIRQITGFTAYTGLTGDEYTGYEGKAVIVFTVLPLYKKQVNIDVDASNLDANDLGHDHITAQQTINWYFDTAIVTDPLVYNVANIADENLGTHTTFEYDSQCKVTKVTDEQYSGPPQQYRIAMRVGIIETGLAIRATFYGLTGEYGARATPANNGTTIYSGWFTVSGNVNTWTKLRTQIYVPMYVTSSGVNMGTIGEVWLEVKYTPSGTPSGYANVSMSGDVTLTGNSTADTVIGGLVAADCQGQPDDGSGTYTGTANALIERPDHILKHILLSRCGLSGVIHAASYAAAGTWYAENSFRLAVPILQPPNVRNLINSITHQARSLEFWEAGEHHLVHIPSSFLEDELSVLLLHMNGPDGSPVFTDDGVAGHTVTPHGNAQIDTAYYKFPTGSGLFGRGDDLTIPDHVNFYMASGRVAIEVWKRFQSADQTAVIYSQFVDNTHFVKFVVHYDLISFQIRNGNDVINFSRVFTGGFTAGTQYHFALIRSWNDNNDTWAITVGGQIVGNIYSNSAAWPDFAASVIIGKTGDWSKLANPTTLPTGTGRGVAFNHDGSLMAVAHDTSPSVTIYNTSDWSKVTNPTTLPTGSGRGVAFNHDGSLMAVAHSSYPFVTIYNTSDWSKLANPTTLPPGVSFGVAFNHDGSVMAVAHITSPYVTIYNTSDWSKIANPSVLPANDSQDVAFNHDGSLLAVAHSSSPFVTIYNTSDWSKIANPSVLPANDGYGVTFNHDGSLMAVAHDASPYVTIYNTSDWSKVVDPSILPAGVGMDVTFNHDGSLLAVALYASPYVIIYNTSDWNKVTNPATLPTGTGSGVAFNHDGSLMTVGHATSPYITTYVPIQYSKGHKDEYRVSKGTGRWTAPFTPSDTPYPNTDPGGGMTFNLTSNKSIEGNRVDLGQIWLKYTDRINIKNKLTARYSRQWSGHVDEIEADRAIVTASDSDSITKLGTLQSDPLSYPCIIDKTQAQAVLTFKLAGSKASRLIVEQAGGYYLSDIEQSDIIRFDESELIGDDTQYLEKALLGLVTMGTTLFRIIDKNYRPDATVQIEAVIVTVV